MRQVVIKQSPIVILRNFLVIEAVAVIAFFGFALLANYAQIYRQFHLTTFLPYQIAQLMGIIIAEALIFTAIFLRWSRDRYYVTGDNIIHAWGMVLRKRSITKISQPASVFLSEGLLSWLVPYGKITIREDESGKMIYLSMVANPRSYKNAVESILKIPVRNPKETIFSESISELLKKGEHSKLEFKSTLRWDIRKNGVNKDLERGILKTVAAFLNSEGGQLIIGASDFGHIDGIENDYKSLGKPNRDGFENHFNNIFMQSIGADFRRYANLKFDNISEKDVCLVTVYPSDKPAYVRADDSENFFVRTGNSTTALKVSESATYIVSWWKNQSR